MAVDGDSLQPKQGFAPKQYGPFSDVSAMMNDVNSLDTGTWVLAVSGR